ncbi:hypothetical protein N8I77_003176 [Diaporthe amygdali]|uniref:Uncharacterized protein n=1 Tax=Phomopsis amygdali TaxID=1214568 RepID=A0AAD9W7E5_PHOAM|nr:hypothetical protein N8I77_003176 [Diaporthe amygdali]
MAAGWPTSLSAISAIWVPACALTLWPSHFLQPPLLFYTPSPFLVETTNFDKVGQDIQGRSLPTIQMSFEALAPVWLVPPGTSRSFRDGSGKKDKQATFGRSPSYHAMFMVSEFHSSYSREADLLIAWHDGRLENAFGSGAAATTSAISCGWFPTTYHQQDQTYQL